MTPEGTVDDSRTAGRVLYEMISGQGPRLFPRIPSAVLADQYGLLRPARQTRNKAYTPNPKERWDAPSAFREANEEAL